MKIGNYEFPEGSVIYMGAYKFMVDGGLLWLHKIEVCKGIVWEIFEPGIFLMLLQYYPTYSYTTPKGE